MLVGLTYDLRQEYLDAGYSEEETAEFDRVDTIEAIETELRKLGHRTERIGSLRGLVASLAQGKRWDLVFNICEGMNGVGREAQVPMLLEAYDIPYTFSDSAVSAVALHKGLTKRIIRDLGVPTPAFALIERESDIQSVDLPFPLFAKPVAEGTGKGVSALSRIENRKELEHRCGDLLARYQQPVLVESYLPGREFTVGLIGTGADARVVGVVEVVLKEKAEMHAYSYVNKEKCEELVLYNRVDGEIANTCSDLALKAWRGLGCRDAGRMDFRLDSHDVPNFLEVNPLAGLHPEHSDLPIICHRFAVSYHDLIRQIVESAQKRVEG